jgi:hypothetical protein
VVAVAFHRFDFLWMTVGKYQVGESSGFNFEDILRFWDFLR